MNARAAFLRTAGFAALAVGCSGADPTIGLGEPIQVRDGLLKEVQFREGELPGTVAPAGAAPKLDKPTVTFVDYGASVISYAGESDKTFTGRAGTGTVALGVKLKNAGSGYWVLPVGAADYQNGGELTWSIAVDFSVNVPTGNQDLLFVAIDGSGHAGTQTDLTLCVPPVVPDNLNACTPSIAPPFTVVSLHWDRPVDLDLQVITPSGKLVSPKHPTTALAGNNGVVDPTPPGTGIIDHDSDGNCVADGRNREDLVFQQKPEKGHYFVYANLFDSCSVPAVRFELGIYAEAPGTAKGTYQVVRTAEVEGGLVAQNENGGTSVGTFITEFVVQ